MKKEELDKELGKILIKMYIPDHVPFMPKCTVDYKTKIKDLGIDIKIELDEFEKSINKGKRYFPGKDQIKYEIRNKIRNLAKELIFNLIDVFNHIVRIGWIPDEWKRTTINAELIAIRKKTLKEP